MSNTSKQDPIESSWRAFESDLAAVINLHSRENPSNTPDFVLAHYLFLCLRAYEDTKHSNDDWHQDKPTSIE